MIQFLLCVSLSARQGEGTLHEQFKAGMRSLQVMWLSHMFVERIWELHDVAIWTVGVVLLGASNAVTSVDSGMLPDCFLGRLVSLDRTFIAVPALVRCACLNPLALKPSKPQTL